MYKEAQGAPNSLPDISFHPPSNSQIEYSQAHYLRASKDPRGVSTLLLGFVDLGLALVMAPFLDDDDDSSISLDSLPSSSDVTSHGAMNQLEDIAVVGMACRLPGGNDSPEKLWKFILEKQVASGEIPPLRWESYYRRDPRNAKILADTTSRGYFVHNIQDFDNMFFGISPKEAILMDPQQRISMEVTWEALESAGIPPQSLAGTNTAVFMGVNSDDYAKLVLEDLPGIEAWMGIGNAACGIPNRISYLLDLRGPSTAVDAACASSLVAIHHGRQALLIGESDIAIVGGVNAICGPGMIAVLDKAGAISKDGMCRSFDNESNGYGRGEGAAIIVLKRLSDAQRNDDRILAVLKSSAVGQDGRTNGIMAPNGEAQIEVARTALGAIDPASIQYVEAHATSTPVGDPVECNAMAQVYGANRANEQPCFIGSVKANVGHLEAGAGGVGFMKAVLALEHRVIPPQANLKTLNQKIDWETGGIRVPLERTNWPKSTTPSRSAVSSYGYGGSVSHAILEAAPPKRPIKTFYLSDESYGLLLLTAPQEKRLVADAATFASWLNERLDRGISSVAHTLAVRRGHHDYRAAFVVANCEEAIDLTRKFASASSHPNIVSGRIMDKKSQKGAVWLFSGHGAHWSGMAQDLIKQDLVFRRAIEVLEPIFEREAGFRVIQAIENAEYDTSDRVQILTFAIQVALATTLKAKGAKPSSVIGHSVGEIAAAVVSGAISADDGALIVARRAVLYRQVMGKGAMAMVSMPFDEATYMLSERQDIAPAIESSPSSCVVSGTPSAIDGFSRVCEMRGVKVLRVNSDVAFHSPLLKPLAQSLFASLDKDLEPCEPEIPLYSTATRDPRSQSARDAIYWVRNMLEPVLLNSAIEAATEDGYRVFIEISTHPVISHSVNETLMNLEIDDFAIIPTLLRNKPAQPLLKKALASMWCKGIDIEWRKLFAGSSWAEDVPRTQWRHQSFWRRVGNAPFGSTSVHDPLTHTLIGQALAVSGEDITAFTSKLDDASRPFPGRHPLHGTEIVPAAVLFNTFLHATEHTELANVNLRVPVAISAPRDIQIVVQPNSVRLLSRLIKEQADSTSRLEGSWMTHTTAEIIGSTIRADSMRSIAEPLDVPAIQTRIGSILKKTFSIDYLARVGVSDMGFPWVVTQHFGNASEMIARVEVLPDINEETRLPWAAASWAPIFDAATSIGSTIFYDDPRLRMPAHVESVTVTKGAVPPKIGYIYVQNRSENSTPISDVTISNEGGQILAIFRKMRFSEIEGTPGAKEGDNSQLVHQLAWVPAKLSEKPTSLNQIVLVGGSSSMVDSYIKELGTRRIETSHFETTEKFREALISRAEELSIFYLARRAAEDVDIFQAANHSCIELLDIVKHVLNNGLKARVFVISQAALTAEDRTALSLASLKGLSRIIAAEHSEIWGALIDCDSPAFPYQTVRYVQNVDVVKIEDSVPKVSRLRKLSRDVCRPEEAKAMAPCTGGTYVISGGLGALGLEVAAFLVERGARRLVLLSRRALPPRRDWSAAGGAMREVFEKIQSFENTGATIYSIPIDISSRDASAVLSAKLESLSLPPVRGVIHAAGIVEDELVLSTTPEAFQRVLAPKIAGALTLDAVFPVSSNLDFFILFSSCGQFFGFPGQASYAAGNAFLDSLAEHRRQLGDNARALQWTSWRGMGMAGGAAAEFIESELEAKGITSVSKEEAFRAWDEIAKFDVAHGVVLKTRVLDADEVLPMDILEEVAVRRPSTTTTSQTSPAIVGSEGVPKASAEMLPRPGVERTDYLASTLTSCVASVLDMDIADVDARTALPDMGMDSVLTVVLRRQMQARLKVKVPPTLIWGHPTIEHLVKWYEGQLGA
ncbi:putative PKS-like protein biosynthetic cluster [Venturia effusa]|uniref:6-methylsalicylic acid synthase n=1 Tax=Venturia effusa TaxID=50376 RepID=A0A517LM34_9PEZI|nr:putative PKS-like protein biosynthetic cluster [Venturia effusa]